MGKKLPKRVFGNPRPSLTVLRLFCDQNEWRCYVELVQRGEYDVMVLLA